jgi:hypothetical protein
MIKRPIIMTGDDKERVLDCIAQTQGFDEALKLVAALKVTLLADHESPGHQGLTEPTRKRAWQMVNELGKILLRGSTTQ